jgi:hypothetical protein
MQERTEPFLVSSQSFPHLWKNLLKMLGIWRSQRQRIWFFEIFSRRKPTNYGLKPLSALLTEFGPVFQGVGEAKAPKLP